VVRFLLDKGAKTDIKDTFYKAPMLDFVLQRKHYGIAKLLIAKSSGRPDDLLKDVADSGQADLVEAVIRRARPARRPSIPSMKERSTTRRAKSRKC